MSIRQDELRTILYYARTGRYGSGFSPSADISLNDVQEAVTEDLTGLVENRLKGYREAWLNGRIDYATFVLKSARYLAGNPEEVNILKMNIGKRLGRPIYISLRI